MTATASLAEKLEELLEESPRAAGERAAQAFDRAASGCGSRIVVYGAGNLGRTVVAGLRANGIEPVAWADRSGPRAAVDGLPVVSAEEAARRFGRDAVFVVAVWNPGPGGGVASIAAALTAAGCRRVVPFVELFWKYPRTFLPFYLWDLPGRIHEQAAAVRAAFALFPGARSQAEFLRHLRLRLTADFGALVPPEAGAQYFPGGPGGLFAPREDEYFVDCGAYDGDTLGDLAEWTGGRFRGAVAIEADPANFAALKRAIATDPRLEGRVRPLWAAVGRRRSTVRFRAAGLGSSAISGSGDIQVDCLPLDDVLAAERPTYIKMDIEGAELDALAGASGSIGRHSPLLAVCAYHTQDHLWRVPLLIRDLAPGSRLLLRPHRGDGFDLVCYAIPPDRVTSSAREDREP
jgi:FkbM family methyltransferase